MQNRSDRGGGPKIFVCDFTEHFQNPSDLSWLGLVAIRIAINLVRPKTRRSADIQPAVGRMRLKTTNLPAAHCYQNIDRGNFEKVVHEFRSYILLIRVDRGLCVYAINLQLFVNQPIHFSCFFYVLLFHFKHRTYSRDSAQGNLTNIHTDFRVSMILVVNHLGFPLTFLAWKSTLFSKRA